MYDLTDHQRSILRYVGDREVDAAVHPIWQELERKGLVARLTPLPRYKITGAGKKALEESK